MVEQHPVPACGGATELEKRKPLDGLRLRRSRSVASSPTLPLFHLGLGGLLQGSPLGLSASPRPPLLIPHPLFICLSISLPRFLISKAVSYYREHCSAYTCLWQYHCLAYCFVKYFGSLENERYCVKWKSILILNKQHRFQFLWDSVVSCSKNTTGLDFLLGCYDHRASSKSCILSHWI